MTDDAPTSPASSPKSRPRRPLWQVLTSSRSMPDMPGDPELGYESAQPWVLGVDAPADGRDSDY